MKFGNILDDFIKRIAAMRNMKIMDNVLDDMSDDFFVVDDISITSAISNRFSKKTIGGSVLTQKPSVPIPKIEPFLDRTFKNQIGNAVCIGLGTGECLIIPTYTNNAFGVKLIPKNLFTILQLAGEDIRASWIITDQQIIDGKTYYLKELYSVGKDANGTSYSMVERFAFKEDKQIKLQMYPGMQGLTDSELLAVEKTIIPNYDKPLFGRIKSPIINRSEINSPYGVPITYGNKKAVDDVKAAMEMLKSEMTRAQMKIFFEKTLAKKDANGNTYLPGASDYLIPMNARVEGSGSLIDAFTPTTRYEQYKEYVEFTMKMLESLIGLSHDTLTDITSESLITATAIRVGMYDSLALVDSIRNSVDLAVKDLKDAVCAIYNATKQPQEPFATNYDISIEWDDSIRENSTEYFNMLMQSVALNTTENAELRAWLHNESLDVARERVAEIESQTDAIEEIV